MLAGMTTLQASTLRWQVTLPALILIGGLLTASAFLGDATSAFFNQLQSSIVSNFGGLYIGSLTLIVILAIFIALSPAGKLRLGPQDARPKFSTLSWFSMLFSAGMGIGLLFYGVAEPVYHFESPPYADSNLSNHALAMRVTFFHWGLHPWALYALVGLALSFFAYRHQLPMTLRSTLYPLLKDKVHGWLGDTIDTLAVVSTLIGVATSLGLGVLQLNAGLTFLFDAPETRWFQSLLIGLITLAATLSVVSGLSNGVRRLSEANIFIAGSLLLAVLFFGPTLEILTGYLKNWGYYLSGLLHHSTWTGGTETERGWLAGWTIFYWAWWIAWAPFVGMFIAKISFGRTIREFLLAVLVIPTVIGFAWLTIFGEAALFELTQEGSQLATAVNQAMPTALFTLLQTYPLSTFLCSAALISIVLFFVTSSDSASLVIDSLATGGHPNPPTLQKVGWALLEGLVAAVLLYVGGLKALQTASLTAALPFMIAIVLMCISLIIGLARDLKSNQRDA